VARRHAIDVAKLAKRVSKNGSRLKFCYEAGCCGYVIHRKLIELGHHCTVVASSKIPITLGERIKSDRRDLQKLAIMHLAGELTQVWVPDEIHEAVRDLVRVRMGGSAAETILQPRAFGKCRKTLRKKRAVAMERGARFIFSGAWCNRGAFFVRDSQGA
jgi:transposase